MIPSNKKIVVEVDFSQKEKISIAGNDFLLGKQYSSNGRERNPVLCKVVDGNGHIKEGAFLLVHHNRFGEYSAHALGNNQYSLAWNEAIFARVDNDGNAHSLCGNIIVDYVYEDYKIPVPAHLRKQNKFKYKVLSNGFGYKKNQFIFAYEFSDYEMVYVFNGKERRVVKIAQRDIVGKLQK